MENRPKFKFRAFISYSQHDKGRARRLHRALETYRVPKGVDAKLEPGRKLGRIFRDDEELAGASALGSTLEGALEESENLVVLCTPSAARSKWVDAEIRTFRQRRTPERVFAVIAAGEANASASSDCRYAQQECFPPALRGLMPDGAPDSNAFAEPLAPDWRKDGFARLRARLAAAILGVDFDSLWKRDRRRARRRAWSAATASIAAAIGLVSWLHWIDLVGWKSGFASRAREEVARAGDFTRRSVTADTEEERQSEAYAADALIARRRAARSAIAAIGTSGMLARPADREAYDAIWDSGLASRRLWDFCSPISLSDEVQFSADGQWLVGSLSSGEGCAARVTGLLAVTAPVRMFERPAALDAAENRVAEAQRDGTIQITFLDQERSESIRIGNGGAGLVPIAFSRDGQRLFAHDEEGSMSVWSTLNGSEIAGSPAFENTFPAALSQHGDRLLAVNRGNMQISMWDVATGSVQTQVAQAQVFAAAFDAGGEHVFTVEDDWVVRTRDGGNLSVIAETRLNGAETRMWAAAIDAAVTRIVTVEEDGGAARVWQLADGALLAHAWSPEEWFTHANLSPDGGMLVTATRNGEVRLWPLGPHARALSAAELRSHLCERLEPRHRMLTANDGWRLAWRLLAADPCAWHGLLDAEFWRELPVFWTRITRGVGAAGAPVTEPVVVSPLMYMEDF